MNGTISVSEAQEFADWYNYDPEIWVDIPSSEEELHKSILDRILLRNREQDAAEPAYAMRSGKMRWLKYAASILLLIAAGAFVFIANNKKPIEKTPSALVTTLTDVSPGTNKAVLTLSDGSTIFLDDAKKDSLGIQGNTKIIKVTKGMVSYVAERIGNNESIYNTMTTPRGGQYQLQLPDGTLVWLNAASSITFPVSFSDSERRVSINGEAYFEVAKNKTKPFIVAINRETDVTVLGTHFNISAYADEPVINTTLVEGRIRVSRSGSSKMLAPGQQATIGKSKGIQINKHANLEEVLAWKNGFFHFDGTSLPAVMRQLSRWYDTDVVFEGKVPEKEFMGTISRNVNASSVLKMLAFTGVHCRIENGKIIVISK